MDIVNREVVNPQSTVTTKDGRRVERFGVDPHPVPIATDDLGPHAVGMSPDPDESFDVESVVSASALVAMLVFVALLLVGTLDGGLLV